MKVILLLITFLFLKVHATDVFTFEKWRESILLNPVTLESESHNAYVDIYVNKTAEAAYRERKTLFPVGSEVYKPLYPTPEKKEIALLVIMRKMAPGYDNEHNDWWYGVYDGSGREGYHTGKIRSCIACHAQARETDYMFSTSVMDRIEHGREMEPVLPLSAGGAPETH